MTNINFSFYIRRNFSESEHVKYTRGLQHV